MIPQRIVPVRHGDARGWFTESYNCKAPAKLVRCLAWAFWDVPDFHIGGGVPARLLSVRGKE